jgi:hypothetical protein
LLQKIKLSSDHNPNPFCNAVQNLKASIPHIGNDEDIVLLSMYKKKRDADKKKANLKTLRNSGATAYNKDGQTAYLTAENLGVKVTVSADTGSDYSAISRSAVADARKRGFPLKVEVLPEPTMLNMAINDENGKQTCSATKMLMSAVILSLRHRDHFACVESDRSLSKKI